MYAYVRDLFRSVWSDTQQVKGKYTYILRDPSFCRSRRLVNHKETIKLLKNEGFSVYAMENLTFVEQIRLFRSSEMIVGLHGAAMAFMIFCKPETQILELFPYRPKKNHYFDVASKLGLRFGRFTSMDTYDEVTEDMTVNLPDLQNTIVHLKRGL
jgi:capsular polysaccharide biosynthesis protein